MQRLTPSLQLNAAGTVPIEVNRAAVHQPFCTVNSHQANILRRTGAIDINDAVLGNVDCARRRTTVGLNGNSILDFFANRDVTGVSDGPTLHIHTNGRKSDLYLAGRLIFYRLRSTSDVNRAVIGSNSITLHKYAVGIDAIGRFRRLASGGNIHYPVINKGCRVIHQHAIGVIDILVRGEVDNAVALYLRRSGRENPGMSANPRIFHITTGSRVNNPVVIYDAITRGNDIITTRCAGCSPQRTVVIERGSVG